MSFWCMWSTSFSFFYHAVVQNALAEVALGVPFLNPLFFLFPSKPEKSSFPLKLWVFSFKPKTMFNKSLNQTHTSFSFMELIKLIRNKSFWNYYPWHRKSLFLFHAFFLSSSKEDNESFSIFPLKHNQISSLQLKNCMWLTHTRQANLWLPLKWTLTHKELKRLNICLEHTQS